MGSVTFFPVAGYTPAELMLGIESGAIDSTQRAALREAGFDFERPSRRQERLLRAYFRMGNVRMFAPQDRLVEQVAAVLVETLVPQSAQVYTGLQSMAAPPGEGSSCGSGGYYHAASRSKGVPSLERGLAQLGEILNKEPEEVGVAEVKLVVGLVLIFVDSGDDIDGPSAWLMEVKERSPDPLVRKGAERGLEAIREERRTKTQERLGQDIDLTPARLKSLLQSAVEEEASANIMEYTLRLLKAYHARGDEEGLRTLLTHDLSLVRLVVVNALFGDNKGEKLKWAGEQLWEIERGQIHKDLASDDLHAWPAAVEILFQFSKAGVAEALSRLQTIASTDTNQDRRQTAQEYLDQLPGSVLI